MKSFITLTLLILSIQSFGQVKVRSYYRKDGTYVQGHYRSNPDGNPFNNWSFPGNTNPYTGKVATGNPSTYLDNYYNRSSNSYSSSNYKSSSFSNPTNTTPYYTDSSPNYTKSNNYSESSSWGKSLSLSPSNNKINSNINKTFTVTSEKAYFYNEPSSTTIRNAYLVRGDKVTIEDQRNNFYYVSFINSKGQKTSGWVDTNMLTFLSETNYDSFSELSFEVAVNKAYFYSEPSYITRKNAYLIYGEKLIGQKLQNGFIYTVFTNSAGVVTNGWIKISDVNQKR